MNERTNGTEKKKSNKKSGLVHILVRFSMLCSSAHILIHKTSWFAAHISSFWVVCISLLLSLFTRCMRLPISLFSGTHNQR